MAFLEGAEHAKASTIPRSRDYIKLYTYMYVYIEGLQFKYFNLTEFCQRA
jgi:hypothetical protein